MDLLCVVLLTIFFWYNFVSLKKDNVIYVDIFKHISHYFIEKAFSDEGENSTFNANVFNIAECLTYTPWLLFLFDYKGLHKFCVTDT